MEPAYLLHALKTARAAGDPLTPLSTALKSVIKVFMGDEGIADVQRQKDYEALLALESSIQYARAEVYQTKNYARLGQCATAILDALESVLAINPDCARCACALWEVSGAIHKLCYVMLVLDISSRGLAVFANTLDTSQAHFKGRYPKSHTFFHLATDTSPGRETFKFRISEDSTKKANLLLKKIRGIVPNASGLSDIALQPKSQRPGRPVADWEAIDITRNLFDAISRCVKSDGCTDRCAYTGDLIVLLTLETHSHSPGAQHTCTINLLMSHSPSQAIPVSCELCVRKTPYSHISKSSEQHVQDNRSVSSTFNGWWGWEAESETVGHICDLLGAAAIPERSVSSVLYKCTLDESNYFMKHGTALRARAPQRVMQADSLAIILASHNDEPPAMTRLMLGVILSYSVFYLIGGPWLSSGPKGGWLRDSIFFVKKNGIFALQPYLQHRFSNCSQQPTTTRNVQPDKTAFHPYPVLVSLAITLMEIYEWRQFQLPDTVEEGTPGSSFMWTSAKTAHQRLNATNVLGSHYYEVIDACLDPLIGNDGYDDNTDDDDNDDNDDDDKRDDKFFTSRVPEYHGKKLRRAILERIVTPLHDDFEVMFGEFLNELHIDKEAAHRSLYKGCIIPGPRDHEEYAVPFATVNQGPPQASSTQPCPNPSTKVPVVRSTIMEDDTPHCRVSKDMVTAIFSDKIASNSNAEATDKWFDDFKRLELLKELGNLPKDANGRIRVAVIDTGVNTRNRRINAEILRGRIVEIRDWTENKSGEKVESMEDPEGHGTLIATIILDIAPNVDLYIARVTNGKTGDTIETKTVAKVSSSARSDNLSLKRKRKIQHETDLGKWHLSSLLTYTILPILGTEPGNLRLGMQID